ncbi:MAG: fibronectin/fibrinogen-binding protein [Oscillochloris sp.]|nr:fibronectin/fibrinogen-binding protein [Oscillochloris sp.]
MYFDALTLTAVADELRETIIGGRIQRVLLTGPLSIGLEIYAQRRRYQLLASAHPQLARVHLTTNRLSRGVEQETPLLLLLRKYVLGGRITAIEQPQLERVLMVSIVKPPPMRNQNIPHAAAEVSDESSDEVADEAEDAETDDPLAALARLMALENVLRCDLVIEPQDRRSNIILVDDDNFILESVKRVTPRMSSRVVMPRRVFELPPPPEKRDPTKATAEGITSLAAGSQRDLARALVATYRGVSPQVAREVVFRAVGRTDIRLDQAIPAYTVAARLRELFTAPQEPSLVPGPNGPSAFAPYRITHLPESAGCSSMSTALDAYFATRETLSSHRQRRDALKQSLDAARERLVRRREQIAAELVRAGELETLRWEGEMIFAFMHELQPGATTLSVENRTIKLDPGRSPVDQAQERFKAYDKAKSALAGLPERAAAAATQVRGVEELTALLELSDDFEQIEQIAQEAEELGYLREHPDPVTARRRRKPAKARPLHLQSADGLDIYVGRSARQNEEVTFKIGRRDDLWVHVRTIHGSHVILRSGGRDIPEASLQQAAGLAAYFSQARADAAVEVDICRRALVRKIPGGPVGLVTYRAEQTLRVAPLEPWNA